MDKIDVIPDETSYEASLDELRKLWGSPAGTSDGARVDELMNLVTAYEDIHYQIELPRYSDT